MPRNLSNLIEVHYILSIVSEEAGTIQGGEMHSILPSDLILSTLYL